MYQVKNQLNKFSTTSILLILIFITQSICLTSCRDMIHDIDSISATQKKFSSVSMIEISDVKNSGQSGLVPYKINAYETTYLLWYEVAEWAEQNGFNIIKPAEEGNTGYIGNPDAKGYLPVTSIHPADIFVWCNALSVKNGLSPVYYKDKNFSEVLMNAADIAKEEYIKENTLYTDANGNLLTEYDFSIPTTFYQNKKANGFRLPTIAEWQYAAQGAKRTTEDKNYKYAGSNELTEVAATVQIKTPGSFKPNGIGAYDMSGNVCEYSIDEDTTNSTVTDSAIHCYGGHYLKGTEAICSVQKLYDLKGIIKIYPTLFGFRLTQTIVE